MNIEVQEVPPTTEMIVTTDNAQENQPEVNQTETLAQTGDANFLEILRAIKEINQKTEETLKNNEKLNKNIESLNEKLNKKFDDNNKNIESLKEDLNKKLDDNSQKMEENMDDISKKMEENNERINSKIDGEITIVRREITEVHERCEQ